MMTGPLDENHLFRCFFLTASAATSAIAGEGSTWDVIQHNIFGSNCASCHREGTGHARQSDLVLTHDEAYDELVGHLPNNTAAMGDSLLRVSTDGGAAGVSQSFLWEKINAPNEEHFYEDHPDYGQIMPIGRPPLTNGELEFVKRWIFEGAPATGAVVDEAVLEDTTRYEPPQFAPLPVPANGIQLHVGPFEGWPDEVNDREFLYFQPHETTEDVLVSRYEISYRPGSHHFILYNYPEGETPPVPNVYRDYRDQDGNTNFAVALQLQSLFPFQFFIGTQVPYVDYHLPEGVALRLPPGSGFDLNAHSVNRTDEPRIGEVYVNLHTVEADEIEHVADYDNFGNFDLNLPPHQETIVSETFTFPETRHIIQMWAHAHEHMDWFRIEHVGGENDGELIYWTNDWEHPVLLQTDTPLTFEEGDQVRLVTKYTNDTDETINWGPLSSDEMQFMFYIYYTGELTTPDVPGDVNGDGVADRYDAALIVANLGAIDQVGRENGDLDGDGIVSLADLSAFQTSHSHDHSPAASAEVPEPTAAMLLLAGLSMLLGSRRTVRRRAAG